MNLQTVFFPNVGCRDKYAMGKGNIMGFSGLHPADLNAAGGLRLAQARLAAKK